MKRLYHTNILPKPKSPDVSIQTIALGKDDNLIITQASSSRIPIGAQTLAPGSAIVYRGKTISLPTPGSAIVVGKAAFLLPPFPTSAFETKGSHSIELGPSFLSGSAVKVSEEGISSFTTAKSDQVPSSTARQENRLPSQIALPTTTGIEGLPNGAGENRSKSQWCWSLRIIFQGAFMVRLLFF